MQLLGKECYDIDIALDNMLGSEFVEKVQEYLSTTGEVAQGLAVIPRYTGHCILIIENYILLELLLVLVEAISALSLFDFLI